jgi:hypothetical protein
MARRCRHYQSVIQHDCKHKDETAAYQACPTTLSLPPLSRISRFLDEICGRAGSRGGPALVEILSDIPVVVGAMEVLSNGSLAVLPVKPKDSTQ